MERSWCPIARRWNPAEVEEESVGDWRQRNKLADGDTVTSIKDFESEGRRRFETKVRVWEKHIRIVEGDHNIGVRLMALVQ